MNLVMVVHYITSQIIKFKYIRAQDMSMLYKITCLR